MRLLIKNLLQKIQVLALAETHYRQDVPRERFEFSGYKVWHADRGGKDKVVLTQYIKHKMYLII